MGVWLYHGCKVNMQIGSRHKHRNIRLAKNKIGDGKTSKDSEGVLLACNPVEVAELVVTHINSTSYPRRSNKHWATEKMHFTTAAKEPTCLCDA